MQPVVHAHFLPALIDPDQLAGQTVVVIDVLRATSTIAYALAAGAREVIPCARMDEAFRLKEELGDAAVLGGERGGVKVEGFDIGNSPCECTPEIVGGKTVVFTTTNGTKAMEHCRQAGRIFLGAFVNRQALLAAVPREEPIHLVCAGTQGEITREDVLLAGCLTLGRTDSDEKARTIDRDLVNDEAQIAADAWTIAFAQLRAGVPLPGVLAKTQGGRNTIRLGLQEDHQDVGKWDGRDVVGELDVAQWRITAVPRSNDIEEKEGG